MNKYTVVFAYILGVASGIVGTYLYMNDKVSRKINERLRDIESDIKGERQQNSQNTDTNRKEDADIADINDYKEIIEKNKYNTEMSVEERALAKPFVIPPEKFGEDLDYDTVSYTYFADGIIADENDMIVSDIAGSIGVNAHLHFGEYEPDIVYIQNDRLKVYYELCLDTRKYEHLLEDKPYLRNPQNEYPLEE